MDDTGLDGGQWPGRPTQPTDLRVTAVTHTTASLAWNPSTDNSGTIHYVVWATGRDGVVPVDQSRTTVTVTGLRPGATYEFHVQAWDAAYNGSPVSNPALATTIPDTTPPSAPARPTVLGVDQSKVLLEFTRGLDALGETTHRVLVDGAASPNVYSLLTAGIFPRAAQERVWVRQLRPGGTYAVSVQAVDAFGNASAATAPVTVTTAPATDVTAPTSPVLLRAASGGNGACPEEIWASWTAATDDGPAGEIEYELRVGGIINEVHGATTTVTYTEFGGPVTVVAVDRAGNASAPSNTIPFEVGWSGNCGR